MPRKKRKKQLSKMKKVELIGLLLLLEERQALMRQIKGEQK